MKRSSVLRDIVLALLAVPFGLLLLWAGSHNAIEIVVGVILLLVLMIGLTFMAKDMKSPDLE